MTNRENKFSAQITQPLARGSAQAMMNFLLPVKKTAPGNMKEL